MATRSLCSGGITLSYAWSLDGKSCVITFSGSGSSHGSLPDGSHTLTVTGSDVTYTDSTTMSGTASFTFWRFFGDFTGQGVVNGTDFALMSLWFGHTLPSSLWYVSYDDNHVDNGDSFSALSENFGHSVSGGQSGNILGLIQPQTFFYSDQAQVVQDDLSGVVTDQYVWGLRYVNDLVLRDRDADSNSSTGSLGISGSGLEERRYVEDDANFNVTSITDTSGNVVERFVYTPYGVETTLNASGFAVPETESWNYLFQGMRQDLATGLYVSEVGRVYDPVMQRWLQQDPAGYVNGANLYQFVGSNPVVRVDPIGTDFATWGGFGMNYGGIGNENRGGVPPSAPAPPSAPVPLANATFMINRGLEFGVNHGMSGAVASSSNPISHTFVFTTDDKGNLVNTYGWGENLDQEGWCKNSPEDVAAANQFLKTPGASDLQSPALMGLGMNIEVEDAYQCIKNSPRHLNLLAGSNCKSEARNLLNLAYYNVNNRFPARPPKPAPPPKDHSPYENLLWDEYNY